MTIANRVTIVRMFMVPICVAFMYVPYAWGKWVAAAVFVLAAATDSLDGYLARSRNEVTTFGKFIDPIADKILVITVFIVLVGQGKMHALFAVIFVAREFIISGFRLVAASKNTVIAADWLGKVKTVVQMTAAVILMLDNWPFSYIGLPMDQISLWLALLFTLWSAFDYLYKNRGLINMRKDAEA